MAATAVGAAAAWIIFTGLSGQAGGHVGTTSTLGALTFTAEPSDAGHNVTPGTPGEGLYDVQNANPSASETVASISAGTVTTSVPG
jgi:hypothetical protein